jgi:penicillin-binding protein 1A
VQGERQPGSAFKPFVLATALGEGISPATTLESRPVTIWTGDRNWKVRNYEDADLGAIDLRTATAYSDNTVYAQLTQLVGPANVAATARRLGITRHLNPYFAIGLGADAVSPLEMARAYSAFANGGFRIDGSLFANHPRAIVSVNGHANRTIDVRVLAPNNAAIVDNLLEQVIAGGTGTRAALPDGRPVAGKTGTTENYGDAWFVGYTPQLVVAVWVGYPKALRPMLTEFHGKPVAGGTYPALIWKSFMEQALPALHDDPKPFPNGELPASAPRRLVLRDGRWHESNGNCRNAIEVVFFQGTPEQPTANC